MPLSKPEVFIDAAALEISWRDERRNLSELIFDTVGARSTRAAGE